VCVFTFIVYSLYLVNTWSFTFEIYVSFSFQIFFCTDERRKSWRILRERERERETDRQTDRQRQREKDRERERDG
jgi:hypothetical protein